jgi:hypothetical protein
MMKFDIEGTLVVLFLEFCELLDGLEIDVICGSMVAPIILTGLTRLSRLSLGSFLGTAREGVSERTRAKTRERNK